MSWWEALILGLVQGASEFLPISSSGHLLLLEKLGIGEENLFFNVMLHLGTLIAVLIAMYKSWIPLLRHPIQKKTGYLLIACVPTVAMAFAFKYLLPDLLGGMLLGAGFVLTACLLFLSQRRVCAQPTLIDTKKSILTGVLQGIAVLPGVSRSGATIAALTMQGVEKKTAAEFSFLLSIPIIIGSAIVESLDLITGKAALSIDALPLAIGMIAAFVSGLISIKFFMKLITNHSLIGFAIYTLLLGIAVTIMPFFGLL